MATVPPPRDPADRLKTLERKLDRYQVELRELVAIARALSQERDISRLLGLILEKSRLVTKADAGSIYVVEDGPGGERVLHFKLSQNDSCKYESSEFTMPVSMQSIAGSVVLTRKTLNLEDVYKLPADVPYDFDHRFDSRMGYRTKSMITVPMISAQDEVIGVIQLINKKKNPKKPLLGRDDVENRVVRFGARSQQLLESLASQAGVALENAMLYTEIQSIFEGFVRASVQAIEQRDPTTSGHSLRVSVMSCRLAELVDRASDGEYASVKFSSDQLKELEYASLLHDFGKIGVREQVLVKAKKLYPHELASIRLRFDYALKAFEADLQRRKLELMGSGEPKSRLTEVDEEFVRHRTAVEDAWRTIIGANEPTILSEGDFSKIERIGAWTYVDAASVRRNLLTPEEMQSLSISKGSLQASEIEEIRSHVVHTRAFLSKIPWGRSLAGIPEIAGAHHERLDGTGYPHRRSAQQIPLQSKIMSIADIYDALTARDRPYKRAIPVDRALEILGYEVKDNHVDADLVRIFVEGEVYKVVDKELSY